jgi:rhamnogalacturonan hydrolase
VIVHGLTLIDSPAFHLVLSGITNSEIYDIRVRGWEIGGTDGIDVNGENIYIHDIHVSNGDECVTTKNPSHNITVERVFCDTSCGTAIGSINEGTNITDITYRNIYYFETDGAGFIKAGYGGTGILNNVLYDTLYIQNSVYGIDINVDWLEAPAGCVGPNNGTMQITNITFRNIQYSSNIDPTKTRPAVNFNCYPRSPCTVSLSNVTVWSYDSTTQSYSSCVSAIGTGFCLNEHGTSATVTIPNSQVQRVLPTVTWGFDAGNSVPKVCPIVANITTERRTYEPYLNQIFY